MKVFQKVFKKNYEFNSEDLNTQIKFINEEHLAIVFINNDKDYWQKIILQISKTFKTCHLVGCTTSGHIADELIYDDEMIITFIKLEKSKFKIELFDNINPESSFEIGKKISVFAKDHQFTTGIIFSDGLKINGSKLADGINFYKNGFNFFGGLAGDATQFEKTNIIYNGELKDSALVVIYLDNHLKVKTEVGSGWQTFGVERIVTKSLNNKVFEIDSRPALQIYDEYLGEKSKLLPAYGLHFPINLEKFDRGITRTLLAIDRHEGSLTYAGDVDENTTIKLMKSESKDLINAAQNALNRLFEDKENTSQSDQLIFSVSCVGRRLVLGQSTEEECELNNKSQKNLFSTGFYSYGELAKNDMNIGCELHNQTFTVTKIYE